MKKWLAIAALVALLAFGYNYRMLISVALQQTQMFLPASLDENVQAPELVGDTVILSFSKTNGFRHHDSIVASRKLLDELGQEQGWQVYHSENGALFQAQYLRRFHLIILNHKTGTTWTMHQRQALREYVEQGGTMLVLHAAGDASNYAWPWYRQQVVKTAFVDHPMRQHIQSAELIVEDHTHPATAHLPEIWRRSDEWYNFSLSPRDNTQVLVSIDESTYDPEQSPMGQDHPMVWWHKVGDGRVFYSALGHTVQSYSEPEFRAFMAGAINWGLN